MRTIKHIVAVSLLGLGSLASGPAMAELTGNVAATSEYIFRGLTTSNGAAVQGGLDYAHDTGLYAGFWISNTTPQFADNNEADFYVGFAPSLSELVSLDVGVLYFLFSEDQQQGAADTSYFEVYGGISIENLSVYAWYANDFFAVEDNNPGVDDGESFYIQADYEIPLHERLALGLHVGTQIGDGADATFDGPDANSDGDYVDYGIALNADMGNDWGATFGVALTDLDNGDGGFANDDDPKFYVSFSKSFTIIE